MRGVQEAVEGKVQAEKGLADAQKQVKQLSQQVQHLISQQQHESAPEVDTDERLQEQVGVWHFIVFVNHNPKIKVVDYSNAAHHCLAFRRVSAELRLPKAAQVL